MSFFVQLLQNTLNYKLQRSSLQVITMAEVTPIFHYGICLFGLRTSESLLWTESHPCAKQLLSSFYNSLFSKKISVHPKHILTVREIFDFSYTLINCHMWSWLSSTCSLLILSLNCTAVNPPSWMCHKHTVSQGPIFSCLPVNCSWSWALLLIGLNVSWCNINKLKYHTPEKLHIILQKHSVYHLGCMQ